MEQVSFEESGCFSQFYLDYVQQQEKVKPFVSQFFSKEALLSFSLENKHRHVLAHAIAKQYEKYGLALPPQLSELEQPDTYTVTTGHQLCLFTGPLYFHYKIMTTIKLAQELSKAGKKTLPVFWMATEDHDFDEVNHFHVADTTYRWNSKQQGAVGEFELDDMQEFLQNIPKEFDWMAEHYKNSKTLAEATHRIVFDLYHQLGIIILDANDAELKKLFIPIAEQELTENIAFSEVENTNRLLERHHYKTQVNPREINLFYKDKNRRARIIKTYRGFEAIDTGLHWSEEDFLNLLKTQPEKISPNVILRPVYQQLILPNIAYIGGPGELIYWMQLKTTHEKYKVPFPILVPRDHLVYLTKADDQRRKKLNLSSADLFENEEILKQRLVLQSKHNIDLTQASLQLKEIVAQLTQSIMALDVTLQGFMQAENRRLEKEMLRVKKKINKAVALKEEKHLTMLNNLFCQIAPNNSLQERRSNFLTYYRYDHTFLNTVFQFINPFCQKFKIIADE